MADLTRRHGGPKDRGSADAYYGRPAEPHKYEGGTGNSPRITLTDPAEIAAYMESYDNQEDRKDWG
jgi:hypothetical protein